MALASLPVSACPTCRAAVVVGERRCRTCGQRFDYGATPPPEPTPTQIYDALFVAGLIVLPPLSSPPAAAPASPVSSVEDESIFGTPPAATVRGAMASTPAGPAAVGTASVGTASAASAAPTVAFAPPPPAAAGNDAFELDRGRHDAIDVATARLSELDGPLAEPGAGLLDALPLLELEPTMIEDDGAAPVVAERVTDLDSGIAAAVGPVIVDAVPDLFHSDVFRADVDVGAGAAAAGDLLQVSPGRLRPVRTGGSAPTVDLPRSACAGCGTLHVLDRCPNCATLHPDARAR